MYKRSHIIGSVFVALFSVFFGYSLVFGSVGGVSDSFQVYFQLSDNIYSDALHLKNTKVVFKTDIDLKTASLVSPCNVAMNQLAKNDDLYLFEIKFLDNACEQRYFSIKTDSDGIVGKIQLNIKNDYEILARLLDYETPKLTRFESVLDNKILSLGAYEEYDVHSGMDYFEFLRENRLLNEVKYMKEKISFILEARQQKYAIPVEGKELSHNHSKIPNSGRPYRAEYTDGIHHGWDIDADFGEQVVALDDGIIVRVVSEFEFHDLGALKKGEGLTQDDKVKNLDILRGKQVWLKTMKGDVVFYSHLDDIFTNIKEGVVVTKGQPLGTVGITGVPDKEYNDYHLHFPIHENPFHEDKIGRYTYDDYMKWRWKFQGQSADFIIEHQYDVFEK